MNPLNYASLEASKRLVDAGIVLETDFCRDLLIPNKVILWPSGVEQGHPDFVPAYQFTEVWRELQGEIGDMYLSCGKNVTNSKSYAGYIIPPDGYDDPETEVIIIDSENPTDALIYLRIWIEEQKEAKDEPKPA